jgi:hypothetical protein
MARSSKVSTGGLFLVADVLAGVDATFVARDPGFWNVPTRSG